MLRDLAILKGSSKGQAKTLQVPDKKATGLAQEESGERSRSRQNSSSNLHAGLDTSKEYEKETKKAPQAVRSDS